MLTHAPTGCYDQDFQELHNGDRIKFLNQTGIITFESGAYGIFIDTGIDWNHVAQEIERYTGTRNPLLACQNDHFISLWEIAWNFNAKDDVLPYVKLLVKNYK